MKTKSDAFERGTRHTDGDGLAKEVEFHVLLFLLFFDLSCDAWSSCDDSQHQQHRYPESSLDEENRQEICRRLSSNKTRVVEEVLQSKSF